MPGESVDVYRLVGPRFHVDLPWTVLYAYREAKLGIDHPMAVLPLALLYGCFVFMTTTHLRHGHKKQTGVSSFLSMWFRIDYKVGYLIQVSKTGHHIFIILWPNALWLQR